jgi:hypothetical protein
MATRRCRPLAAAGAMAVSFLALLGCAPTSQVARPPVEVSSQLSTTTTLPDPHAAAVAAASALLALTPVPPGAQRRASSPVPATDQAPETPASPDLVDQPAWWTAPGTIDTVIAWVDAHAPAGGTGAGHASESTRGVTNWLATGFTFPAVAPMLTARQLAVLVAPDGPGHVALRADAQVLWRPRRSPDSLIDPVAVQSITVDQGSGATGPATPATQGSGTAATSANRAIILRIVNELNGLPVDNAGVLSCPAAIRPGFSVRLVGDRGAVIATVSGSRSECGGLNLIVGGKRQPAVDDPGHALLDLVTSLSGAAP